MSDDKNKKKITVHADPEEAAQLAKPVRPARRPKVTVKNEGEGTGEPTVKLIAQKGAEVDVNVVDTGEKPVEVKVLSRRTINRQPRTITIPPINWGMVAVIAAVAFIVFLFVTRSNNPAPVGNGNSDGQNTTTNQETVQNCPVVNGVSEGAIIRVMEQQYLQSSPSINARAVRGIVVTTTDDLTVVSNNNGCDDGRLWVNVRMATSSSNATGWVIIQEDGQWLFGFADVPAPATTEQANNTSSGARQSMRSIRVGSGTCVPVLQPADFQDATQTEFGGYWIYSTSAPGNVNVRSNPVVVGETVHVANHNIVALLPVGQGVEVIGHADGFHFACGSNMVYWHVRYHDAVLGPIEGWIAEGNGNSMFMEGAD